MFFLEIELLDGNYVTVRRSVAEASKIAFKKHATRHQDFSTLPDLEWDHFDVPFDRAKELLDSLLDWRALKPWDYRKGLGYFLRSQDDFRDVFQLRKFANSHADWKPFLAHILGFNAEQITQHYTALGLQSIITLIDSDLPPRADDDGVFDQAEIVVLLHDEGDSGRLFKMKPW